jgi:hypothetical protein
MRSERKRAGEFLASQIFLLFDANVPFHEITIPNTAGLDSHAMEEREKKKLRGKRACPCVKTFSGEGIYMKT